MLLALVDWVELEGCGGFILFFSTEKSEVRILMVRGLSPRCTYWRLLLAVHHSAFYSGDGCNSLAYTASIIFVRSIVSSPTCRFFVLLPLPWAVAFICSLSTRPSCSFLQLPSLIESPLPPASSGLFCTPKQPFHLFTDLHVAEMDSSESPFSNLDIWCDWSGDPNDTVHVCMSVEVR